MSNKLVISNIQLKTENGFNELGGYLDNDYIYFRVPKEFQLNLTPEWFISVALLVAMESNRTIKVESPLCVSSQLLEQLKEVQAVFSCWNPDLHIVDILAETSSQDHGFTAVGSFFSAGVDGSHTLTRHIDDISHLIMLRVFDSGDDQASWDQHVSVQTAFAATLGKSLIPVESNVRDWSENKLMLWKFFHGLVLTGAATALGLKRLYIASSHTYDYLMPWGSHVVTDPMWSTESTKVIHDGAACTRTEKTREILQYPDIANNLKVCWYNLHKNCGTCSKCVRTMTAIYLLGSRIRSLPALDDLQLLKAINISSDSSATSVEELILLAKNANNQRIYNILRRHYKKYQRSKILSLIDQCYLGGIIRRLYRKVKKPTWLAYKVTLESTNKGNI